uniref:Prothoracicotropic hormone n=1 Tax=Anopheles atroparvus TaxID=41427 RepID=A0AAG5DCL3_ANOAO
MRFALVVCGLLFVLILAPIDGRLKYTEVLPEATLESMLRRPVLANGEGNGASINDVGQGDDALRGGDPRGGEVVTDSHDDPNGKQPDGNYRDAEADVKGDDPLLNCFPSTNMLHKYDWARYHLRHVAEKSRNMESAERQLQHPGDGFPGEDANGVDETDLRSSVKRSDYNRELSADLYAQYPSSCACQTKYELLDLGHSYFPRYIVNAICQNRSVNSRKCWRGSSCKEIPYKVRVLTRRAENEPSDLDFHSSLLPEPLREYWRFKTVTIAAACQCSI